ncbi:DUF1573 domain-containing protein [Flavobacterium sp. CS20]|uniref:DUF1573 domain-containing protein n=1 Tax=Flavobacterium sp. CS20 TaxID=2775246 RepID=UPI001B39E527|nr:DUF1573 domain-containing protein [Flavobacterium sp. CS20]QTY27383.1 DUF1573 domain-containing protein [Flavobacterium sp. CS20]
MKTNFLILFLSITSIFYAQKISKLEFDSNSKDYGTLKYGEHAQCEFYITNTGKENVVIKSLKSNSRNIEFKLDDSLIKPGQKIKLVVIYNTENPDSIRKTITVFTDAKPSVYTLSLKGRVLPKP